MLLDYENITGIFSVIAFIVCLLGGIILAIAIYHYLFRTKRWFNFLAVKNFNITEKRIYRLGILLIILGFLFFCIFGYLYSKEINRKVIQPVIEENQRQK